MLPRVRGIATVVAVVVGISAPAFAEISESQIEKARDKTLTKAFQDDLPGFEYVVGDPDGAGGGTGRAGDGSGSGRVGSAGQVDPRLRNRPTRDGARRIDTREYQERERARDEAGPVSGLMTMFMWGLIAVAVALMLFWFISEFAKSDADVAASADENDAAVKAATAAIIDKPLDDADVLASRGEFVEAIHTLLLRTLQELAKSAMVRVERSHTSREILARVPLAPDARDALSVLITYVELTHFGDEPAGANDYARCREQFHVFANVFRAGLAITASKEPRALGGGTSLAS